MKSFQVLDWFMKSFQVLDWFTKSFKVLDWFTKSFKVLDWFTKSFKVSDWFIGLRFHVIQVLYVYMCYGVVVLIGIYCWDQYYNYFSPWYVICNCVLFSYIWFYQSQMLLHLFNRDMKHLVLQEICVEHVSVFTAQTGCQISYFKYFFNTNSILIFLHRLSYQRNKYNLFSVCIMLVPLF